MREIGLIGLIALAFGGVSLAGSGEATWFSRVNVAAGGACLLWAAGVGLMRARGASAPAFRGPLLRAGGRIALAVLVAVAAERGAASLGVQFDWSFESKFVPSQATLTALSDLCEEGELQGRLYYDDGDARRRSTRVLLQTLAHDNCLAFEERRIEDYPEDEDRFGLGTSNTVVFVLRSEQGETWESIERPTQGALFEALFRLRQLRSGRIYVARGTGEGNFSGLGQTGFSGLTAALQTEGYEVSEFVSAAAREVPSDANLLIWVSPERHLASEALGSLRRYLQRGGRLLAMLEPGSETGLEEVLTEWGIQPLGGAVVDPASGSLISMARGLAPLAYTYSKHHPVTRGLDTNRLTFFRGVRSFRLRKPEIHDRLQTVVFASPRAWIAEDEGVLRKTTAPAEPPDARHDYWPLVVTGRYEREAGEVRIVAFGDSELASNQFLRSLYNVDLVMNAVHWAAEQQPLITLRPKQGVAGRLQFPLALQNTLTLYQSLGLLLPEILLLAAAVLWARSRG